MIFGNPAEFAIESDLDAAYERLSLRALGYFQIHIAGRTFGVLGPEATILASIYEETRTRISRRGVHTAPFSSMERTGSIADELLAALFAPNPERRDFLGMPREELSAFVYENQLMWAPDGSEAFDDGSFGLQFDVGDRVRLIGFRCDEKYQHLPDSLGDAWLGADQYYETLRSWCMWFDSKWASMPKMAG